MPSILFLSALALTQAAPVRPAPPPATPAFAPGRQTFTTDEELIRVSGFNCTTEIL